MVAVNKRQRLLLKIDGGIPQGSIGRAVVTYDLNLGDNRYTRSKTIDLAGSSGHVLLDGIVSDLNRHYIVKDVFLQYTDVGDENIMRIVLEDSIEGQEVETTLASYTMNDDQPLARFR